MARLDTSGFVPIIEDMVHARAILALFLLCLVTGCASVERLAVPSKGLKAPQFAVTGQKSVVQTAPWDQFLATYAYVDGQGVRRIDYARVTPADRQSLKAYIESLVQIDTAALTKPAQLAHWANLYNALTVDVILDHYPVASIRDIKDGFTDLGPWNNKRAKIKGVGMSLHDIEHGIIRPLWSNRPTIHYILNCGAAGCPNIAAMGFTADTIDARMNDAARTYINGPRGVTVTPDGRVAVSKIYNWYRDDFGGNEEAVLNHIRLYAAPDLLNALENKRSIDLYYYDWSLNDKQRANSLQSLDTKARPPSPYNE